MSKQKQHQNKREPLRVIIVRAIAAVLCFLMVFSVIAIVINAYASIENDLTGGDEINVALFSGATLAESLTVSTGKGFQVEVCSDGEWIYFDEAVEIKSIAVANGDHLVSEDGVYTDAGDSLYPHIGGYRIMVSSYSTKVGGSSANDNIVQFRPSTETTGIFNRNNIRGYISRITNTVEKLGGFPFPAFIDKEYYICLGEFPSMEAAENFLDAFKNSYICEAEIIGPDGNAYSVIDTQTGTLIMHFSDIEELSLTPVGGDGFSCSNGEEYYGRLAFTMENAGFKVTNTLYMEQYIACRLAAEADTSWNTEALKAIATVIRTNAYAGLGDRSAHRKDGFDFCSNAHCGSYHGCANVNKNVIDAVDATRETVIKSSGRLINALYGSCYGGATISLAEAYGELMEGKGEYLIGIVGAWENYEKRTDGRWKYEISPYELYELLSQRMSDCPLEGNISSVEVISRSENEVYVTELRFTDIFENTMTLRGGEIIRNLLSGIVDSANFVVGTAGSEVSEIMFSYDTKNKENTSWGMNVKLDGTYGNFVFCGRGIGSGLGLSLCGAKDLANKGYSYENAYIDIIKTYYSGVTVEKINPSSAIKADTAI